MTSQWEVWKYYLCLSIQECHGQFIVVYDTTWFAHMYMVNLIRYIKAVNTRQNMFCMEWIFRGSLWIVNIKILRIKQPIVVMTFLTQLWFTLRAGSWGYWANRSRIVRGTWWDRELTTRNWSDRVINILIVSGNGSCWPIFVYSAHITQGFILQCISFRRIC